MSTRRQALPRGGQALLEARIDSHLISERIGWQNLITQVVTLVIDPSWVWLFPAEVQKITFRIRVQAVWSPFSYLPTVQTYCITRCAFPAGPPLLHSTQLLKAWRHI